MGVVMLQVLGLVLKACAFSCFMVIHALAGLQIGERTPGLLYDENILISIAPVADPPSYGTGFQPPLIIPPRSSGPVPQSTKGLDFSPSPSSPSTPPPTILVPPIPSIQHAVPAMPPVPPPENPPHAEHPPSPSLSDDNPVPSMPPSISLPLEPRSPPPNSRPAIAPENNAPHSPIAPENNAPHSPIAPVSNASAPTSILGSPPPSHSFLPEEPPSLPPDMSSPPPSPGNSPSTDPILPEEPPSSPPGDTCVFFLSLSAQLLLTLPVQLHCSSICYYIAKLS